MDHRLDRKTHGHVRETDRALPSELLETYATTLRLLERFTLSDLALCRQLQVQRQRLEHAIASERDTTGATHYLAGLCSFQLQDYSAALRHLEVAVVAQPERKAWRALLAHASASADNGVAQRRPPTEIFRKEHLTLPAAVHLRAPEGFVVPPHRRVDAGHLAQPRPRGRAQHELEWDHSDEVSAVREAPREQLVDAQGLDARRHCRQPHQHLRHAATIQRKLLRGLPLAFRGARYAANPHARRATGEQVDVELTRERAAHVLMEKLGLESLAVTLGHQHMPMLVENNYPPFMFSTSTDGLAMFDLAAADIVRARERGVPAYNQFRAQLGRPRCHAYSDITRDPRKLAKLESVYGPDGLEKVDLQVGLLFEDGWQRPFQGFDDTRFAVFLQEASRRLEADPFFTEKWNDPRLYTREMKRRITEITLKSLLLRHMPELACTGLAGVHNAFEPWGTTVQSAPEEHPLSASEEWYARPPGRDG